MVCFELLELGLWRFSVRARGGPASPPKPRRRPRVSPPPMIRRRRGAAACLRAAAAAVPRRFLCQRRPPRLSSVDVAAAADVAAASRRPPNLSASPRRCRVSPPRRRRGGAATFLRDVAYPALFRYRDATKKNVRPANARAHGGSRQPVWSASGGAVRGQPRMRARARGKRLACADRRFRAPESSLLLREHVRERLAERRLRRDRVLERGQRASMPQLSSGAERRASEHFL